MADQRVAGTPKWDKYAKGTPDSLSKEQEELVEEFLTKCPPEQIESMRFPKEPVKYFACRVLRARKFVVEDSLKLVLNTTTWRKTVDVDGLRKRDPVDVLGCAEDELMFYYPKAYFPNTDKEGRPVYVERGGIADADALLIISDEDKLVDYHTFANETQMRDLFTLRSEEAGRPVTTLLAIIDMDGMTMRLANGTTTRYISRMVGIDSSHYPETLGKMLIINVPSFFSLAYALITPFLDERTQRKIEIMSSPSVWKPRLIELVGEANVPVEYGGTCVVPGGLYTPSRTIKTNLPAGAVVHETFAVTKGQEIQVKWFTRPGDIKFSMHFGSGAPKQSFGVRETKDSVPVNMTEVYKERAHPGSDKVAVIVRHTADTDGYILCVYSNAEGWRGRELLHRNDELVNGKVKQTSLLGYAAPAEGKA